MHALPAHTQCCLLHSLTRSLAHRCRVAACFVGALLENVFVAFICILKKVPVFIVGKPGNSKSLALQLLNISMRGLDSKDEFLKHFPGVNVVAFQGSMQSTSDGILKIFETAKGKRREDGSDPSGSAR